MPTLDADFDSASLNVAASSVEGDRIRLVGRDNYYGGGRWKWINFKLHQPPADRTLVFSISDQFSEGPDKLDDHAMVFSEDGGQSWQYFAHHQHPLAPGSDSSRGLSEAKPRIAPESTPAPGMTGSYHFHHDRPFHTECVQIAYAIPYPVSLLRDWIDTLDVEKQSLGEDLWRLNFGEGEKQIVLMSGVHPNESIANHTLQGAVEHLIAHRPEGCRVSVFPLVNPSGRRAGLNRTTAQHIDRDANRVWSPKLWRDMDEIRVVAEALPPGKWDVFVDFHAWADARLSFVFMDETRNYPQHPIWEALTDTEPLLDYEHCGTDNASTETLAILDHDAGFAMTYETTHRVDENIERYRAMGRHVAEAIIAGLEA
ncbi:MAG: hypothetical protein IT445_15215 [Phycisphaeraceae bacterium]|nr:hypothetical protein [Phycisphaeraceae bacterium]